jgi:hypothetical protein
MRRRDDKRISTHPRGETSPCACHEAMLVGTMNKVADFPAKFFLAAGGRASGPLGRERAGLFRKRNFGFGEVFDLSEQECIKDDLRCELKSLETLEGDGQASLSPFGLTRTICSRRKLPLSSRAGVIHMSPTSSRTEILPPDVVVISCA